MDLCYVVVIVTVTVTERDNAQQLLKLNKQPKTRLKLQTDKNCWMQSHDRQHSHAGHPAHQLAQVETRRKVC